MADNKDDWEDVPLEAEIADSGVDDWEDLPEKGDFSKTRSALRGLGQGATFGFADEIAGGFGSLGALFSDESFADAYRRNRDEARELNRLAKEANPKSFTTGNVAGGVASSLIPVAGQIGRVGQGATLGARVLGGIKAGGTLGALAGAGSSEADLTKGELGQFAKDTAISGGTGAALGGAIPLAGAAISRGTKAIGNSRPAQAIKEQLDDWIIREKPNAEEIRAASKALGIEPTPAMLKDSKRLADLEDVRSRSGSIFDRGIRKKRAAVEEQLSKASRGILDEGSDLSRYEVGERTRDIVSKNIKDRFAPISESFDELASHTKHMDLPAASRERVARNIENIPELVKFGGSITGESSKIAKDFTRILRSGDVNANDLKQMKTMLNESLRNPNLNATDKRVLGVMRDRLTNLENNTIKRSAIRSARTEGEGKTIGKSILDQLSGARTQYREGMQDLGAFGKATQIKPKGAGSSGFVKGLDDIQTERLIEKMFPLGNVDARTQTIKQFPEAARIMQQSRIGDIGRKVGDDARKFIREVDKLAPEAASDLFGPKGLQTVGNMKTVTSSLPQKLNTSGTSEATRIIQGGLLPFGKQVVADIGNAALYKGMVHSSNIASGLKKAVETTPQVFGKYSGVLQNAALRGGNALNATNYVLQQQDPEYRQQMKSFFDDQDDDWGE